MQPPINQLYKFGHFCLDVGGHVLKRDGRVAPLSPKLFDTLPVLIETGDEPLGGVGQSDAGTDGAILRQIEAGAGTRRSVEAGSTRDAQGRESAASLLLGEFHPIRRGSEPGGQAMT
jgi:hypothetical protein